MTSKTYGLTSSGTKLHSLDEEERAICNRSIQAYWRYNEEDGLSGPFPVCPRCAKKDANLAAKRAKDLREKVVASLRVRQSVEAAQATFERFEKTLDDLEELRDETRRNLCTMATDLDTAAWDIRDYLSNLTDAIDRAMTDLG
jgi:septal ring factor EnvC (AmiA/AmiB activator)